MNVVENYVWQTGFDFIIRMVKNRIVGVNCVWSLTKVSNMYLTHLLKVEE